jgi:hypothetical protein
MARKNKKSENYLDMIPFHNEKYGWKQDEEHIVTILVENKGVFNRMAQKFLKKPKVSQIHLEEMGSFIWLQMDGKRSVYDIAQQVQQEFGEKAEPLYDRLVTYLRMLQDYEFVRVRSAQAKTQK